MELIIWKQFLLPKLMGIETYTPQGHPGNKALLKGWLSLSLNNPLIRFFFSRDWGGLAWMSRWKLASMHSRWGVSLWVFTYKWYVSILGLYTYHWSVHLWSQHFLPGDIQVSFTILIPPAITPRLRQILIGLDLMLSAGFTENQTKQRG